MDKIRVLQAGANDWARIYDIPEYVEWDFYNVDINAKPYDIVFIDGKVLAKDLKILSKLTTCHRLFLTENAMVNTGRLYEEYVRANVAQSLSESDIQEFISNEIRNYFHNPYGEKFTHERLCIAHGFKGTVKWDGKYAVVLNGEYGTEFSQIAFWRNNIPVFQGQAIDFWLEYEKDPEVEIELKITQFISGSISEVQNEWIFSERDMQDIVYIDNQDRDSYIFASINVKGAGMLKIIALHDRYSRRGHGHFLPGGERYVTSKREECFCYFEPGDMKPPMNVYFSGYKTMEGFEGLNMLRRLGCPFLLVSEARLDGGGFYMGSKEYEETFLSMITDHMNILGFDHEEVILSGLSMGTYGALYYGCDLNPHAIISGKPLTSIGYIAENEKHLRPGGFPTSLDVLKYHQGDMSKISRETLNDRFWNKFDESDWSDTKFIVSYMIEDDYDPDAYEKLMNHIHSANVQLYGKGVHGRHNDDTSSVVMWFEDQFKQLLFEDFDRRSSDDR